MSTAGRVRHRAEQMYGLIEQWNESGQGKQAFCAVAGIAVCVFDYWRRKQKMNKVEAEQRVGFREVKAPQRIPEGVDSQLRLHYPDGRVLEFAAMPSAGLLREILTW